MIVNKMTLVTEVSMQIQSISLKRIISWKFIAYFLIKTLKTHITVYFYRLTTTEVIYSGHQQTVYWYLLRGLSWNLMQVAGWFP